MGGLICNEQGSQVEISQAEKFPSHTLKNIYKSYKVQCSYPLKTTQDMCFEKLCSWKPHYRTTICLMQLMCKYTTYVIWKYKALKNKYHIWNSWSFIIIVYVVGLGSILFFDKHHLTLFANCTKVVKNNYGATNMQLGFNA